MICSTRASKDNGYAHPLGKKVLGLHDVRNLVESSIKFDDSGGRMDLDARKSTVPPLEAIVNPIMFCGGYSYLPR